MSTATGLSFTIGSTLTGGTSAAKAIIDRKDSDELYYHQTEATGFISFSQGEGVADSDGNTGTLLNTTSFSLKPKAMPFIRTNHGNRSNQKSIPYTI